MPLKRTDLMNVSAEKVISTITDCRKKNADAFAYVRQENGNYTVSAFFNCVAGSSKESTPVALTHDVRNHEFIGNDFTVPDAEIETVVEAFLIKNAAAALFSRNADGTYKAESVFLHGKRPAINIKTPGWLS